MKILFLSVLAVSAVLVTPASALPSLQLDASPSKYVDGDEETIVATSNPFTLFALANKSSDNISLSTTYYLSMAITKHDQSPMTIADKNFGTFTISGVGLPGGTKSYSFSDLVFGNPPFEANISKDNNDLASHSIFPTYFAEISFLFDANQRAKQYNSADDPGEFEPSPTGGLYYQDWNIDVTGLLAGYDLHFDLYDETVKSGGDIDVDNFAPFSHDAVSGPHTTVPDATSSFMLFSLALLGLAGLRYRFSSKSIP